MKYIKKIILENFQSHKYSVIEFDSRLNVIVGPSDSGKSAIIRGLKWVLYNEPQGDYFIREGEKECSVTLEFNDNTVLKRYRSKSKNMYIITKDNGEEIKYEGFGTGVPEEIIEEIGIKKIYLDSELSNSINLGEQLEGAFLLSEKNSTRASAIGRLVGVNVIDDALREVLKDTRGLNSIKKSLEESFSKLSKEISTYDYLDELKLKVNKISDMKSKIEKQNVKLQKLTYIKNKLTEIHTDLINTSDVLNKLNKIDDLNSLIINIENTVLKNKYLNNYRNTLDRIRREKEEDNLILDRLKNIQTVNQKAQQIENHNLYYKRILNLTNKYEKICSEKESLNITLSNLISINKVDNCIDEVTSKIYQYNKLVEKIQAYLKVKNSIDTGKIYMEKLSKVSKLDDVVRNIDLGLQMLIKCKKLYEKILKNKDEKAYNIKNISKIDDSFKGELGRYKILLEEIEICPFCLSDIDEGKIDHIINNYIGG
jgi:DNA repair exonuclease SbcCD ATPase subunit